MSKPDKEKFSQLVKKYVNREATAEEIEWLENYYDLFEELPNHTDQLPSLELLAIQQRMKHNIKLRVGKKMNPFHRIHRSTYLRWAAAVILVAGLATTLFYQRQTAPIPHLTANDTPPVQQISTTGQTRFVLLPDGSKVVLHGNSKIRYDKAFNSTSRTVELVGEAYFDVVHRRQVPFVIKTGTIKTTVLGTAFTIRALPDRKEVTVTVSRGKVKVENGARQTTFLTANKQITYQADESVSLPETVNSEAITAWLHTDMVFDNMPFGELAQQLEKRYGVPIAFDNPTLKNCLITGRFSGTESLDDVFKLLALTSRTKYTISSDKVVISGASCF